MRLLACLSAFWLAVSLPGTALAYIGPGAGLTAIGTVLAFLGVLVLLIAGFLWYPVKRLIRRLRGPEAPSEIERAAHDPDT